MKKLILLLIGILITGGLYFLWQNPSESTSPPQRIGTSKPTTQSDNVVLTNPLTVTIPKLGISAAIESVGMDEKGNMDVPKNADNVAWYNLGYKIGDNGSAVIAGHYDKQTGAPAVFYTLSSLSVGDLITVTSEKEELTYKVTGSKSYNFDSLPLEEIFNTPGKPTLHLITCEGVFDKTTNLYSKRLVVYSELVKSE